MGDLLFGCFDFLFLALDVGGGFVEVDCDNSGAFGFLRGSLRIFYNLFLLLGRLGGFFFVEMVGWLVLFLIKVIFRNGIMQCLLQPEYILLNTIQRTRMMRRLPLTTLLLCYPFTLITQLLIIRTLRYTAPTVFSGIPHRLLMPYKILKLEHSSAFCALRGGAYGSNWDSLLLRLGVHIVGILLNVGWVFLLQDVLLRMSVVIISGGTSRYFGFTIIVDPSLG